MRTGCSTTQDWANYLVALALAVQIVGLTCINPEEPAQPQPLLLAPPNWEDKEIEAASLVVSVPLYC